MNRVTKQILFCVCTYVFEKNYCSSQLGTTGERKRFRKYYMSVSLQNKTKAIAIVKTIGYKAKAIVIYSYQYINY